MNKKEVLNETKIMVHHSINLKARNSASVVDPIEEVEISVAIYWCADLRDKKEERDAFLWGYYYDESFIGDRRDLSKEEYKKISHDVRKESFEFDKNFDNAFADEYAPDLNPCGGSYYM